MVPVERDWRRLTHQEALGEAVAEADEGRWVGIGNMMKNAHILREYAARLAKLWIFWFWSVALDILGLLFDTFFPGFEPIWFWYLLIPAVGLVAANVKLFAEDQAELERYRTQTGVPTPAALALESDRRVYAKLQETMKTNDMLSYLREADFAGSFDTHRLEGMYDFIYLSESPEFEFIDDELEPMRKNLGQELGELRLLVGMCTFPLPLPRGWNRVDDPAASVWRLGYADASEAEMEKQHGLAMEKGREMNKTADEICTRYAELVRLARRRLGM